MLQIEFRKGEFFNASIKFWKITLNCSLFLLKKCKGKLKKIKEISWKVKINYNFLIFLMPWIMHNKVSKISRKSKEKEIIFPRLFTRSICPEKKNWKNQFTREWNVKKNLCIWILDNEAEWIEIWFSFCSSSYIADWNVMLNIVMLFVLDDSTFTKFSTRSVFTVILWLIDLLTL